MNNTLPETGGSLQALSNELATRVEHVGRALVAVNARPRIASSGIHWRPGIIVTADHTIRRDEEITVTGSDGRTVQAALVGRDPTTDLAVLKIQDQDAQFPTISKGDLSTLKVGHLILAVGRTSEHSPSASMGVVSAISGAWRTWGGGQIDHFIRLDVALYPGFSGSALVNAKGAVVGINTTGPRNLAMTIPASTVNRVIDELLTKGRIARGYLGLGMQPVRLPETFRSKFGLARDGGVVVVTVEPGGPAEKAGVFIGDVLIGLDDAPIDDPGDVQVKLDPDQIGKNVKARIIRGGSLIELTITVGERPRKGE